MNVFMAVALVILTLEAMLLGLWLIWCVGNLSDLAVKLNRYLSVKIDQVRDGQQ
jgi:hypothetical protein